MLLKLRNHEKTHRVFASLSTTANNINKQSIILAAYKENKVYFSNSIYSVFG